MGGIKGFDTSTLSRFANSLRSALAGVATEDPKPTVKAPPPQAKTPPRSETDLFEENERINSEIRSVLSGFDPRSATALKEFANLRSPEAKLAAARATLSALKQASSGERRELTERLAQEARSLPSEEYEQLEQDFFFVDVMHRWTMKAIERNGS